MIEILRSAGYVEAGGVWEKTEGGTLFRVSREDGGIHFVTIRGEGRSEVRLSFSYTAPDGDLTSAKLAELEAVIDELPDRQLTDLFDTDLFGTLGPLFGVNALRCRPAKRGVRDWCRKHGYSIALAVAIALWLIAGAMSQ